MPNSSSFKCPRLRQCERELAMNCRRRDEQGQGSGVDSHRAAPATIVPIFRLKFVGCAAEKAAEPNSQIVF